MNEQSFFRAFRKSSLLLYLFPLQSKGVPGQTSMLGMQEEHASMTPNIIWLFYTLREASVVFSLLFFATAKDKLDHSIDPDARVRRMATAYNFYAAITFGITLVLKNKVSTGSFQIVSALSILTAALSNGSIADKKFLVVAAGLILYGHIVMLVTWWKAVPKNGSFLD